MKLRKQHKKCAIFLMQFFVFLLLLVEILNIRYLDFDLFVGFCIDCYSLLAEIPHEETSASRE